MKLKNTNHKLIGRNVLTNLDELKSCGLVQVPACFPKTEGGIVIRVKSLTPRNPAEKRMPRFGTYGRVGIMPLLRTGFPGATKMMTRKEVDKLRKDGARVRIVGSVHSPLAVKKLVPDFKFSGPIVSHSGGIPMLSSPEGGGGRIYAGIGSSGRGGRGGGSSRIERGKGRFAARFYGPQKNRKDELDELLLVVVELERNHAETGRKLAVVKEKISSLIEEEKQEAENLLDEMPQSTGLFKRYVDEASMADCFYQMHEHFYGKDRTEMLKGGYGKEIDFVALLYILVIDHKIDGDKLGVKPFHAFIKKYVLVDLKPTYKTMDNRLKLQFLDLVEQIKSRNGVLTDKNKRLNEVEENYLAVRGIFHKTDYYKQIKCLLRK